MDDIISNFFQSMGTAGVSEVAKKVGGKNTAVKAALRTAIPLLIAGMAKNALDKKGAEKLTKAIKKDHDGSILDQVGNLTGDTEVDGAKILGHILGSKQDVAQMNIAKTSGMDPEQARQLMAFAGPLLLGTIGKQVKEKNLKTEDIVDMLQQTTKVQETNQPWLTKFATDILDKDGDGQITDDLMNMLKKSFK